MAIRGEQAVRREPGSGDDWRVNLAEGLALSEFLSSFSGSACRK